MINFEIFNYYECDLIKDYLNKYESLNDNEYYHLDSYHSVSEFFEELDVFISRYMDKNKQKQTIKSLKKLLILNRVNSIELEWIDKTNKRMCVYLWWMLLNKAYIKNDNAFDYFNLIEENINGEYRNVNLNIFEENLGDSALTLNAMYRDIFNFINRLNYNKESKIELINIIKLNWVSIYNNSLTIDFIDEDNYEQCKWAYNYIEKVTFNKISDFTFNISNDDGFYLSIVLYIDLIDDFYTKKKLISQMKKAWTQKKHRDKNKKLTEKLEVKDDIHKKIYEICKKNNIKNKSELIDLFLK